MIVNSVFLTETEPGGAILTIKVYSILFGYNKLVIELIGTPYKHLVYDMLISNIYPTSSPSGHWFTCFLGFPLILSSKTLWKLFLFSLVVNLLGNLSSSPQCQTSLETFPPLLSSRPSWKPFLFSLVLDLLGNLSFSPQL